MLQFACIYAAATLVLFAFLRLRTLTEEDNDR